MGTIPIFQNNDKKKKKKGKFVFQPVLLHS